MKTEHYALGGAGLLLALLYLAGEGDATGSGSTAIDQLEDGTEDLAASIRTWEPWTPEGDGPGDTPNTADEGEVGRASSNGVVYDDPEVGPANDEPGDDANATFEDVNEVAEATGHDPVDPTTYAPDVQDGATAPSGGVVADPGGSQTWGDAQEQANDDLTERAANSNMSDDMKSAFDRLANYDDPSNL